LTHKEDCVSSQVGTVIGKEALV